MTMDGSVCGLIERQNEHEEDDDLENVKKPFENHLVQICRTHERKIKKGIYGCRHMFIHSQHCQQPLLPEHCGLLQLEIEKIKQQKKMVF
jgi:hypothetical protein